MLGRRVLFTIVLSKCDGLIFLVLEMSQKNNFLGRVFFPKLLVFRFLVFAICTVAILRARLTISGVVLF